MDEIEGTTVRLYVGRWMLLYNRHLGWREWQKTDYFIVGLAVER
jgi:hypothetical protein